MVRNAFIFLTIFDQSLVKNIKQIHRNSKDFPEEFILRIRNEKFLYKYFFKICIQLSAKEQTGRIFFQKNCAQLFSKEKLGRISFKRIAHNFFQKKNFLYREDEILNIP